jgi:hypothetical protein
MGSSTQHSISPIHIICISAISKHKILCSTPSSPELEKSSTLCSTEIQPVRQEASSSSSSSPIFRHPFAFCQPLWGFPRVLASILTYIHQVLQWARTEATSPGSWPSTWSPSPPSRRSNPGDQRNPPGPPSRVRDCSRDGEGRGRPETQADGTKRSGSRRTLIPPDKGRPHQCHRSPTYRSFGVGSPPPTFLRELGARQGSSLNSAAVSGNLSSQSGSERAAQRSAVTRK